MRTQLFLLAIPAIAAITPPAFGEAFGPIHVAANRGHYVGHCPVEIVFTGDIDFVLPHPKGFVFNYHWERSDGAKGAVKVVRPGPNERRLVIHDKWRLGAHAQAHDVAATLVVNSGNTHLSETSPTVHIECR